MVHGHAGAQHDVCRRMGKSLSAFVLNLGSLVRRSIWDGGVSSAAERCDGLKEPIGLILISIFLSLQQFPFWAAS